MNESNNPFIFLLVLNSFISVILIVNQNESKNDSAPTQNESSVSNPLETATWICLILELILLVIQLKVTDF